MLQYRRSIFFIILLFISSFANAIDDVAVMGLIKDKVILRINGAHHTLREGESLNNGVKLVEIGKNRRSIILEINGEALSYRLGHGTTSPTSTVKLSSDSSGVYRVKGKINNKSVNYIVDTGASLVSLNSKTAEELGIDYKSTSRIAKSETANGLVPVYLVTLNSVEVGGINIKNVEAAIHEGEYPRMVLLGMSFLKQLKMEREGDILSLQLR